MPKNPIPSWDRENSSEVMDYVLELLNSAVNTLLHEKMSVEDGVVIKKALGALNDKVSSCRTEELLGAVSTLSRQIQELKDRVAVLEAP